MARFLKTAVKGRQYFVFDSMLNLTQTLKIKKKEEKQQKDQVV
jgi:hypothetical protein